MPISEPESVAIITAAYRAILAREPDPDGLTAYAALFNGRDTHDAFQKILEGLLGSAEFAKRTATSMGLAPSADLTSLSVDDVEVAMIVCNEEDFISTSLEPLLPHFSRFIILDMNSEDNTVSVARDLLGSRLTVLSCSQGNLLHQGYGWARNFAAASATKPWLLFVDADEVLQNGIVNRKIDLSKPAQLTTVATIERRNLDDQTWTSGAPIDLAKCRCVSVETKRRLYKCGSGARWQGYIHEEIVLREELRWGAKSSLVFNHFSNFKEPQRLVSRNRMYSWMLLRLFRNDELREGVNRYWLDEYIPRNLAKVEIEAQEFIADHPELRKYNL
jgi:glycosyltransferase involved in cell wall biosynthesis